MKRFLTLDLETVPDEGLVSAVDGEPSRPYAEQVRRLLAERRARSGGRSDFLPLPYHRPVAACTLEAIERDGTIEVEEVSSWTDRRGDEARFLERLWSRMEGATIVTFHGRGFDLPVLELRSLKLGVATPAWFSGARSAGTSAHVDLREIFANGGAAPSAPLDLYAKLLGLPGKEEVAGEDVQALYERGDLDRIAAYCMTDVVQTFLVFLRYRLLDGSLAPEAYARSARGVRHSLPALFARRLGPAERALLDGFLERCAPYFDEEPPRAVRRAS